MILLGSPVNLSGLTQDDWNTVSLSTWLPSGATGALIELSAPTGGGQAGWRKTGSSFATTDSVATSTGPTQFACGVNASRQIDLYHSLGCSWTLIGYFGAEAVFFTEPVDHFPASGNTWDTDTLTEAGSDSAQVAFLQFTGGTIAWRPTGNSTPWQTSLGGISGVLCPLNGSKQFDFQTADASIACSCFGYLKTGWTDSLTSITPASINTWTDKSVAGANSIAMAVITTANGNDAGLRKNGAGDTPYGSRPSPHQSYVILADGSGTYEIYMGDISTSSASQWGYLTEEFLSGVSLQGVERGRSTTRGLARGIR